MTVRIKIALTSLLISVPVAYGIFAIVQAIRSRDLAAALERAATAQITEGARAQCEEYPQWYLAGPRESRPTLAERQQPDADVLVKRPSAAAMPFEFFAYSQDFTPLSTAAPALPPEMKNPLRVNPDLKFVSGPFQTRAGSGFQQVRVTGWGNPCAMILFRLYREANHATTGLLVFLGVAAALFLCGLAVSAPTEYRIRTVAQAARTATRNNYEAIAPVSGRDEISALAADFNEAGADIRRRMVDVKDRDDALRRLIAQTADASSEPIAALEQQLTGLNARDALRATHDLNGRLGNIAAAARLKMTIGADANDAVDLSPIVTRVVTRYREWARQSGIGLTMTVPPSPVIAHGDAALFERVISNLVDNAIRHNQSGGHAEVVLEPKSGGFSLRVGDDSPNLPDETFAKLNAIRRFRGDEGRTKQPGDLGLGLAIVREVCDRYGIQWTFRRRAVGGFQAELAKTA